MTLERRDPLPPGRYWIDVFGDNRVAMTDWLRAVKGSVKARVTESNPDWEPPREWHMFDVLSPVHFDSKRFGFPTVATPEVQSSDDTVQKPPPPQATDILPDAPTLAALGGGMGMLALIVVGALLFMQSQKRG